jgi:hypothetical protein
MQTDNIFEAAHWGLIPRCLELLSQIPVTEKIDVVRKLHIIADRDRNRELALALIVATKGNVSDRDRLMICCSMEFVDEIGSILESYTPDLSTQRMCATTLLKLGYRDLSRKIYPFKVDDVKDDIWLDIVREVRNDNVPGLREVIHTRNTVHFTESLLLGNALYDSLRYGSVDCFLWCVDHLSSDDLSQYTVLAPDTRMDGEEHRLSGWLHKGTADITGYDILPGAFNVNIGICRALLSMEDTPEVREALAIISLRSMDPHIFIGITTRHEHITPKILETIKEVGGTTSSIAMSHVRSINPYTDAGL